MGLIGGLTRLYAPVRRVSRLGELFGKGLDGCTVVCLRCIIAVEPCENRITRLVLPADFQQRSPSPFFVVFRLPFSDQLVSRFGIERPKQVAVGLVG
jgi:hypothetical protein